MNGSQDSLLVRPLAPSLFEAFLRLSREVDPGASLTDRGLNALLYRQLPGIVSGGLVVQAGQELLGGCLFESAGVDLPIVRVSVFLREEARANPPEDQLFRALLAELQARSIRTLQAAVDPASWQEALYRRRHFAVTSELFEHRRHVMAPLSQKFEQSADQADASGYRALIGMPDAALQQEFVALLVASLREATGEVNSARAQVTISSWYRLAKQDRVSAYVLKADGRLVSAAALIRKEPRTLHYVTVGTAPEERNSGVNSLLRRKVHQWAATHDVDVLSGVVASTNTPIMNIVRALNSTLLPYALHFELNLSSNAST